MRSAVARPMGLRRLTGAGWWNARRSTSGVIPTWAGDYENGRYMAAGVPKSFSGAHVFTRASVGNAFNAAGILTSHTDNVPRFRHNPATGASAGLMIEMERANALFRSRDHENAAWTKHASLVVAANNITAPNGATEGDKITGSSAHFWVQDKLTTGGDNFTSTIWRKAFEDTTFLFKVRDEDDTNNYVAVNPSFTSGVLSLGSVTTAGNFTNGAAKIKETAPNGWYRIELTGTSHATTVNLRSDFAASTGATKSVYCWNNQLELVANLATSDIYTAGVGVTRKVDLVTMVASGGLPHPGYNTSAATGNTYVFKGIMADVTANQVLLSIATPGDLTQRIQLYIDGGDLILFTAAPGNSSTITLGTPTAGVEFVASFSCKTNATRGSLDGAAEVSFTGTVVIPPVTEGLIGRRTGDGSQVVSATVNQVIQYPIALAGAELIGVQS